MCRDACTYPLCSSGHGEEEIQREECTESVILSSQPQGNPPSGKPKVTLHSNGVPPSKRQKFPGATPAFELVWLVSNWEQRVICKSR